MTKVILTAQVKNGDVGKKPFKLTETSSEVRAEQQVRFNIRGRGTK